jgi:hypothetical protein
MNRYNDSLEHIHLSENSQNVANVLWSVQRFGESYNDSRNRYNDSLFFYTIYFYYYFFYFFLFFWALFISIQLFNVGHWIYSEINLLNDERPRFVCYFLLNYNLLQTSDLLRDLLMCFNIRACASILVLLRLFDSLVNSIAKIRAGGVAGNWDHYFPIRQVF